jgi:hypothetical protein
MHYAALTASDAELQGIEPTILKEGLQVRDRLQQG